MLGFENIMIIFLVAFQEQNRIEFHLFCNPVHLLVLVSDLSVHVQSHVAQVGQHPGEHDGDGGDVEHDDHIDEGAVFVHGDDVAHVGQQPADSEQQ